GGIPPADANAACEVAIAERLHQAGQIAWPALEVGIEGRDQRAPRSGEAAHQRGGLTGLPGMADVPQPWLAGSERRQRRLRISDAAVVDDDQLPGDASGVKSVAPLRHERGEVRRLVEGRDHHAQAGYGWVPLAGGRLAHRVTSASWLGSRQ